MGEFEYNKGVSVSLRRLFEPVITRLRRLGGGLTFRTQFLTSGLFPRHVDAAIMGIGLVFACGRDESRHRHGATGDYEGET